jgi:ABC-type microcin C transport system permease subunit YejB
LYRYTMVRFAGKLIIRMIPPRVVAMLWWEYLMLVCAAWFSCVVGIAYFHGILLDDYPAVLLTPFIPSMIALVVRLCYTMPLNPTVGALHVEFS